jgi:hypothetical protein
MLYLLHMGNHPELTYRGGQSPIVHLEAEIVPSCDWAEAEGLRWAFALSNAGAVYTEFRDDLADWRDPVRSVRSLGESYRPCVGKEDNRSDGIGETPAAFAGADHQEVA